MWLVNGVCLLAQPKEVKNKYADKDKPKTDLDVPLDDPAAERARQQRYDNDSSVFGYTEVLSSLSLQPDRHQMLLCQCGSSVLASPSLCALVSRLIEAADFEAAQELFGGLNLDTMPAETVKDLEKLAEAISRKYVLPHSGSKHYKALLKGILKHSLPPLPLQETKDLESTLAGIRTDKLKEEQAVARQSTVKKGEHIGADCTCLYCVYALACFASLSVLHILV